MRPLLLAGAELIYPSSPGIADPLFGIAPLLTALGLVLAGVAVLRAGRWTSWHRFTPLLLGIYVVVILTPVLIISGGPPAVPALWAIAGWDACWMLIGISVLAGQPRPHLPPHRADVRPVTTTRTRGGGLRDGRYDQHGTTMTAVATGRYRAG